MRFLLALLLLALPGQAGRAPVAHVPEQRAAIAASDGHLAEHIRGAQTISVRADASRPSSEGASRSSGHPVPASRVVATVGGALLARGSPLERGFREAARGSHLPYYSLAPPAR